jgi:glycosyltransferase involved in cell wall biosynthesis
VDLQQTNNLMQQPEDRTAKIYYAASSYASHARTARSYYELLQKAYWITPQVEKADIVILHYEPHLYEMIYKSYPILRTKYVIGCSVWEASELPRAYAQGVDKVQEIWTCSDYCRKIFDKYHPRVIYIPHVIERDIAYSEADLNFVKQSIGYEQGWTYYLSITKYWDKRKNTEMLVRTFERQRSRMPRARLIVKGMEHEAVEKRSTDSRIAYLPVQFSDSQLNALYSLIDVYVSPHHSEGWGLTLSDAMLFHKPVIGTGYSGNLEYMNRHNSYLVDYSEETIRVEDCYRYFSGEMKWAYPDETDLADKLTILYDRQCLEDAEKKVHQASEDIKRFNADSVGRLICERLEKIGSLKHIRG